VQGNARKLGVLADLTICLIIRSNNVAAVVGFIGNRRLRAGLVSAGVVVVGNY
jgi:hypothetical protein